MKKSFKKLFLVSSGPVAISRAPAGVAFLAGVCEKNQIDYVVLDLNVQFAKEYGKEVWQQLYAYHRELNDAPIELLESLDSFLEKITKDIVSQGTDCVAISVLSHYQISWTKRFLNHLRRVSKDIVVIAGGPGIGTTDRDLEKLGQETESFGRHLVNLGLLDYYAMGEGDFIFDQFLQGVTELPGLNTRDTLETWQPQLDNLDELTMPSYRNFDFASYETRRGQPVITITGSRGCVRRCSFCDIGYHWKKFRFRSGRNIADEIVKHHLELGATDFFFNDSLLNGSISEFINLMEVLIEYKQKYPSLQGLKYAGQFIIRGKAHHPEKMYQLMSESGCDFIQVGIESGSEAVRDHMGKKFSNSDIDFHFEMCEKYKITNWLFLMISYPTETQSDFEDTLTMLKRSQKYLINKTILGASVPAPVILIPKTPLEELRDELQIHYYRESSEWLSGSNSSLTINEKYRRWIEVVKTSVELGYCVYAEVLNDVRSYQDKLEMLSLPKKKPFEIPVVTVIK